MHVTYFYDMKKVYDYYFVYLVYTSFRISVKIRLKWPPRPFVRNKKKKKNIYTIYIVVNKNEVKLLFVCLLILMKETIILKII